ncbi:MAG TPA: taurine ABC transporter substrate-binding protein [Thermohalobaculum sp.]|nr:taurine ABC transporter substrate-binding protein [Thermohalobaculum sp.]
MRSIGKTLLGAGTLVGLTVGVAQAQDDPVTVGYQIVMNPWKVAIADGTFEEATGREIDWRKFDSGSKVITAMASGDVDIAMAGSSPIAAGVSRELPIELFWIVENIADAEALVVHEDAGIEEPEDLKGKKIAVPFVSTTHFHMLFALEHWGIDPAEVELLNMQPNAIAAAWDRGDIDGAFVWDPALGRIKESGEVLITSGELAELGKATFDGMIVTTEFADNNAEFMCQFVSILADADAAYRDNPEDFGPDSENAQKIVDLAGGEASQVSSVLELYDFPTMEEQASDTWLGGGEDTGAAAALRATSEFLLEQKQIEALLPSYADVVTAEYVEDAMDGC